MADLLEEIKLRTDIVEVVSQYVQLKKAGKNFKGLCPFHNEKTPSFIVSPEKQIAWCFGCQKGGDIFNFIQELENIDFNEAVNLLAEKVNIDVEQYRNSTAPKISKTEKDNLFQAYEATTNFYHDQLTKTEEGQKVLTYLHNRGINDQTIKEFQVGFAPDTYQSAYKHLLEKDFTKETLLKAEIVTAKDTSGNKIYDRFHGRLMFPIQDKIGRIVAFGGRALKKGQEPKYLNSSESNIYNKSNLLYGYSHNKQEIKRLDYVIIVEGYFDVMASHQAGAKNVVATCGTALTPQHIQLLKRLTKNLIFAFDTDKAGIDAARRGVEVAEPLDMNIRVVTVEGGKDAADLVQEDPQKWLDAVSNARPYLKFFISHYLMAIPKNSPNRNQIALESIFPLLQLIKSRIKLDEAIRFTASQLNLNPQLIYDDLKNLKLPSHHPAKLKTQKTTAKRDFSLSNHHHILGLMISYPESIKNIYQKLQKIDFLANLQNIYNTFWNYYNPTRLEFDKSKFFEHLSKEERHQINILTLYIENKYKEFSFDSVEKELNHFINLIEKTNTRSTRSELLKSLKEAEQNQDSEKINLILKQIQETY